MSPDKQPEPSALPVAKTRRAKPITRAAIVLPLLLLAACAAMPEATPTSQTTAPGTSEPTAAVIPTPAPSATPNRPVHAGAPAIDEPFWLLYQGTSVSTRTDRDGVVTQTDRGESYQVLNGGSLEGTILVNGEWVGILGRNVTEGEAIPGLDPIEEQYGAQIDDVLPADDVLDPGRTPNPNWLRSNERRGDLEVFVRVPAPAADASLGSSAFWWDPAHEHWYQLSVMSEGDFEAVLTALLGAR